MESFKSNAARVLNGNDDFTSLFSGNGEVETGDKKRMGARVRAFLEVNAAVNKAETEGWDFNELRDYLAKVEAGTVDSGAGTGKPGVVKRYNIVGRTRKGSLIFSNCGDREALAEMFETCWSFPTRKVALSCIDSGNPDSGTLVF